MDERELIVSQRELHRIHVVRLTLEGRESVGRGAEFLGISTRQMKRLRQKMRERGMERLLHGNRGRRPWNRMASDMVETVIELAGGRYKGSDTKPAVEITASFRLSVSLPLSLGGLSNH